MTIAMLLITALYVVFCYTRKAMRQEAIQKASQTVEATVQQIDNILLNVEQTSGNIYWDMLLHLNEPDRMFLYSRQLVETNPYITGAAIAFEPYFFKDHGQYFMAYVYRTGAGTLQKTDSPIIQAETFGNRPYTEQLWFTSIFETRMPTWVTYRKNDYEYDPFITYSLPIYSQKGIVGVLAVDVSLTLLSDIILSAKPSPNSYALVLDEEGSIIVHPDKSKLLSHHLFTTDEQNADKVDLAITKAMMEGKWDYNRYQHGHEDCYVFYKPFKRENIPGRTDQELSWSIAIVYPTNDIFDEYNHLRTIVVSIAIISLILLMFFCLIFTHRQLLPLRMLAKSAQRIADGHYNDTIPDAHQQDEVGQLQRNFQQMQKALSANIGKLEELNTSLKERGEVLGKAYEQAKEADRVKTAFLHNMTNQMIEPTDIIANNVALLSQMKQDPDTQKDAATMVGEIEAQGRIITSLLNSLIDVALEDKESANKNQPV